MADHKQRLSAQKKRFYTEIAPSRPNDWEVDEIFDSLADLAPLKRDLLLSQVAVIWPVSHSLCFSFLTQASLFIENLAEEELPELVRELLSCYEQKGLLGARKLLAAAGTKSPSAKSNRVRVRLEEVYAPLSLYLQGLAGRSLELREGRQAMGDGETVWLPGELAVLKEREENRLLYKLLVSLQWACLADGLFHSAFASLAEEKETVDQNERIYGAYANKRLAADCLAVVQFCRSFAILQKELPGLASRSCKLLGVMLESGLAKEPDSPVVFYFTATLKLALGQGVSDREEKLIRSSGLRSINLLADDSLTALIRYYPKELENEQEYTLGSFGMLLGSYDFNRAAKTFLAMRKKKRDAFVALLAKTALENSDKEPEIIKQSGPSQIEDLLLVLAEETGSESRPQQEMVLAAASLDLPLELVELFADITKDLGGIPDAYVQAAAGIAAHGIQRQDGGDKRGAALSASQETYLYHEWDFRRQGYRRDWCRVYEKQLAGVRSNFYERTSKTYKGALRKIARQFELLRHRERFLRRQRYGDDIDFDAMVESLGDRRAGFSGSERLYQRLSRQQRDVTTFFLVDMSSSTEGWVGTAIKESLVLLTKALESADDPYAIFGFSGMRRSKCEIYRIKDLAEPMHDGVRQRIAAISPLEYTRLGPPVRHLTALLKNVKSKLRLLVIITDGKPEDYDDYKGRYALLDTRKAFQEALGEGIHPYCITIDKTGHEYLALMCGHKNYVHIDRVELLPTKMVAMYRRLTI